MPKADQEPELAVAGKPGPTPPVEVIQKSRTLPSIAYLRLRSAAPSWEMLSGILATVRIGPAARRYLAGGGVAVGWYFCERKDYFCAGSFLLRSSTDGPSA
jgi:hypothetical protein